MIPKHFIELALAGGWYGGSRYPKTKKQQMHILKLVRVNDALSKIYLEQAHEIVCDPTFWRSLGKELKWQDIQELETRITKCWCSKCGEVRVTMQWPVWKYHAQHFFELLLSGGDTDSFWKNLIK